MLISSLVGFGEMTDQVYQDRLQSGNYSLNEEYGSVESSPIQWNIITLVAVLLPSFMAIGIALSINVLGSGLSGQIVPIILTYGIGLAVWGVLSTLSLNVFLSIPAFGLPIYFGLSIMFIFGLVTSANGGD